MILSISEVGFGSKGAVHKKKKIKLLKECKREKTKNNCEQKEKKTEFMLYPSISAVQANFGTQEKPWNGKHT